MEYKYINLFLLFIIVILITMNYNLANRQELFINHSERHNANIRAALNNQTDKERERKKRDRVLKANLEEGTNYVQDSESLQDMFKAVSTEWHPNPEHHEGSLQKSISQHTRPNQHP